jgi:hypothetical protein
MPTCKLEPYTSIVPSQRDIALYVSFVLSSNLGTFVPCMDHGRWWQTSPRTLTRQDSMLTSYNEAEVRQRMVAVMRQFKPHVVM